MSDVLESGVGVRSDRSRFAVVAFHWLFTAAAVLSATLAYAPAAPPRVVAAWAALGALHLVAWAVLSLRLIPGTPSRTDDPGFWLRAGKAVALGNNVIVVLGIWLLAPYGPDALRTIAMMFCVTYIAVGVIATPHFSWVHYLATVTGIGSLIAVMARGGGDDAWLAPFLILFGAGVLLLSHILQRSRRSLEGALQAAETARAEAMAQRDARLQFLASASHDFGQPLQAARLYFEQTQLGAPADRTAAAAKLGRALEAMEQMVAQVTDHLRLDAAAVMAARTAIPLAPVIARVVEMNEPAARARGVQLRTLPTRLVALGDAVLIERALGNLVGNAIRHAQARRILVGARRKGARVRLWVIDDGRGVAEPDRARLFEPYVQGSDHGGEVRGGYGLGLSAVRLSAAALDGCAGHAPVRSGGSAFFLELPTRGPQPDGLAPGEEGRGVLPDLR